MSGSSSVLKHWMGWLLVTSPFIALSVSLWLCMRGDLFPPFHDGGNWLKLANALAGNTYPMWEQTPLQYPPLFNALLALLVKALRDGLLAIKVAGVLVVALMPLAAYPLAREVSGSRKAGLVATWMIAFQPIFQEMFGWGGYPNALGLLFLFLAFYFLLKAYHEESRKCLAGAAAFSSLVVLSHHLTTIVFFAIALGCALFYVWMRSTRKTSLNGKGVRRVAFSFAVALVVFVLWRLSAGPFQYTVFNPASLSTRPFNADAFWWIFKSEPMTALLFVTSILGAAALALQGKQVELALLATWVLFPFVFTQAYLFGIALDFRRFPLFSVPPLAILSSSSLLLVKGRSVLSLLKGGHSAFYLLILLLGSTILVGAATQQSVFAYYHYTTDYVYSDKERLDALSWIRENTPPNAVIVADDALGRWIEGLSGRRVLMALPPFQAFLVGEVDRYEAADLILHSNVEVRNEFLRLRDGTPHWARQTPWFAISRGNGFKDLFYVVDAYNRVSLRLGDKKWVEAPYRWGKFSMHWLERGSSRVTMVMKFFTDSLLFEKVLGLDAGLAEVTLSYNVTPLKPVKLESMNVSLWVPWGSVARVSWLELEIDGEPIHLSSEPAPKSVSLGRDPEGGQLRILITYVPTDDEFHVTLKFAFPTAVKNSWSTGVKGLTLDEAVENYGVAHIAVGKRLYDMDRLYADPRFREVYSNLKIAVFEVKGFVEG